LELPSSGAILIDGQPVIQPDPSRSLVFQDPTLFPWLSVWRNVATGLDARGVLKSERHRVDEARPWSTLRPSPMPIRTSSPAAAATAEH
jgi:ABC-type taurine transport system ATPase subunit